MTKTSAIRAVRKTPAARALRRQIRRDSGVWLIARPETLEVLKSDPRFTAFNSPKRVRVFLSGWEKSGYLEIRSTADYIGDYTGTRPHGRKSKILSDPAYTAFGKIDGFTVCLKNTKLSRVTLLKSERRKPGEDQAKLGGQRYAWQIAGGAQQW